MRFLASSFASALVLAAAAACSTNAAPLPAVTPGGDGGNVANTEHLDASCAVTVQSYPLLPAVHVPIGTSNTIVWNSDPPSSGEHYPVWAAFQTYTTPIDPGYWVHDLEHGAIVFLYKCEDGGSCADVAASFQAIVDAMPNDPLCSASECATICGATCSARVRAVILPDASLKTPIAAVAWGWTYTADCLDPTTLAAFAKEHYGQGPEQLCCDGQSSGLAPQ